MKQSGVDHQDRQRKQGARQTGDFNYHHHLRDMFLVATSLGPTFLSLVLYLALGLRVCVLAVLTSWPCRPDEVPGCLLSCRCVSLLCVCSP